MDISRYQIDIEIKNDMNHTLFDSVRGQMSNDLKIKNYKFGIIFGITNDDTLLRYNKNRNEEGNVIKYNKSKSL